MYYNMFNETSNIIFHLISGKVMYFTEAYSESRQTPKVESFAKIVNG